MQHDKKQRTKKKSRPIHHFEGIKLNNKKKKSCEKFTV
jgi:hypothetical protein